MRSLSSMPARGYATPLLSVLLISSAVGCAVANLGSPHDEIGLSFQTQSEVQLKDEPSFYALNRTGEKLYFISRKAKNYGVIHGNGPPESFPLDCSPSNFVVNENETELYIACAQSGMRGPGLQKISLATHTVLQTIDFPEKFLTFSMVLSSDGRTLYVTDVNSLFVYCLETTPLQIKRAIALRESSSWASTLSNDGTKLYVLHAFSNALSIIDTHDNSLLQTVRNVGYFPTSLIASRDGRKLYIGNSARPSVTIVETDTLRTSTITIQPGREQFYEEKVPLYLPDLAEDMDDKLIVWHPDINDLSLIELRNGSIKHFSPLRGQAPGLMSPSNLRLLGMTLSKSGTVMALITIDGRVIFLKR